MRSFLHACAAFTLIEVLVAVSLFGAVGVIGSTVYLNISRGQQTVGARNSLYDDAQFILDELSREIRSSGLDYEEYYNRIVLGGKPGMNFGHYASQFYYDTDTGALNCITGAKNCSNVGKHPTIGNFPEKLNAFYKAGVTSDIFCDGFEPLFSTTKNHVCVKELYLMNGDGTKKTFIAPESIDWKDSKSQKPPHVLSRASMVAAKDAKNNVLPHLFRCENDSLCPSKPLTISTLNLKEPTTLDLTYPDPKDLTGADGTPKILNKDTEAVTQAYNDGKNFVPFTPSRVDIKSIRFFISPSEDPLKAFGEENPNAATITLIHQPQITILLTIQPSSNVRYKTSHKELTVQTTVTPGLFAAVNSYPPQMVKNP
jgi:prepilin-type N-terminal cleavage/methylation domain-containing protein